MLNRTKQYRSRMNVVLRMIDEESALMFSIARLTGAEASRISRDDWLDYARRHIDARADVCSALADERDALYGAMSRTRDRDKRDRDRQRAQPFDVPAPGADADLPF